MFLLEIFIDLFLVHLSNAEFKHVFLIPDQLVHLVLSAFAIIDLFSFFLN